MRDEGIKLVTKHDDKLVNTKEEITHENARARTPRLRRSTSLRQDSVDVA